MWLSVSVLAVGEALVFAGLWWLLPPAALIVLGVQMVAWALLRSADAAS